jgi:hypothetical protein
MRGSATLTAEPSMKAMLEPRMVAANTQGFARSTQPGVAVAARITPSSHGARPEMIIGYMAIQSAVAHLGTLPLMGSTLKIAPKAADSASTSQLTIGG